MNGRVLVLRPSPGAEATAARAVALGLEPVIAPLFIVKRRGWSLPGTLGFAGVMFTSANAARHAGPLPATLLDKPAYAVGAATAAAARAAGFRDVRSGSGDAMALLAQAADDGVTSLLHLAGREHRAPTHPAIRIERRIVYAADPVGALPPAAIEALKAGAVALLHSPRGARLFGDLIADRPNVAVAAISPAALAAAGPGWAAALAAARPDDAALLAAAARLCNDLAQEQDDPA